MKTLTISLVVLLALLLIWAGISIEFIYLVGTGLSLIIFGIPFSILIMESSVPVNEEIKHAAPKKVKKQEIKRPDAIPYGRFLHLKKA